MGLEAMAARVAGYDFRTKAQINALVIGELARATGLGENDAAVAIMDSEIHGDIQRLADAIQAEADRLMSNPAA